MPNYHVIKSKDGGWAVRKVGGERISGSFDKQDEAAKAAKKFAANAGGGEVRVHDRDGQIRDNDTVSP